MDNSPHGNIGHPAPDQPIPAVRADRGARVRGASRVCGAASGGVGSVLSGSGDCAVDRSDLALAEQFAEAGGEVVGQAGDRVAASGGEAEGSEEG